MSSGGSKNQTTTQNNDPPAWATQYYTQGLNLASNVANQPYSGYQGPLVAGQTADQVSAQNMVRQQAGNPGVLGQANRFTSGLLGGQGQFDGEANPYTGKTTQVGSNRYAGSNPYLSSMIQSASKDVTDAYTKSTVPNMLSQFQSGGAFGGTAMQSALSDSQQNLASQLGDLSNQFRFQDYTTQQGLAENDINRRMQAQQADLARNAQLADSQLGRDQSAWDTFQGRQMQAMGMAPQLNEAGYYGANQLAQQGMQQQMLGQAGIDANREVFDERRDWQQNRLGSLAQMLGTIQGGSSSTTGANPNYRSAGQNALTAAAIAASFFSDEDSKTDKQPMNPDKALEAVRKLPIETWRYHGDSEQHAGTYSQDFYKALGMQPKEQINSIDMFGALGGAVQALDKKLNGKRARA